MKASLKISGNSAFTLFLMPETDAEREILRRVTECRNLTCADLLRDRNWMSRTTDCIEIMPMPPKVEQEEGR